MKLKVGCTTYPVRYVNELKDGDRTLAGQVQYYRPHIYIDKNGPNPSEALLHETLHAVFTDRGLHNILCEDHEELIVESVSNGLMSVIRDNPKFLEVLRQPLGGR